MRFELTILGTASQAPTRERGQGGYVLRWEDELVLFDPGEGCQRQLLYAGVSAAHITRVCISHFHGDHCLGLPGFVQSRALVTDRRLTLHYAQGQEEQVERLLYSSVIDFDLRIDHEPLAPGEPLETPRFQLICEELEHPTPSVGFRLAQPGRRHVDERRATALGVEGAAIGELVDRGEVVSGGRAVTFEEVTDFRDGPVFAFVMDTAPCPGATSLAAGADLLLAEATFLEAEADVAAAHGHMTASMAARLAADAGVHLLVLSHFSSRYSDLAAFEEQARAHFSPVIVARDFQHIVWDARHDRLITSRDPGAAPSPVAGGATVSE